MRAISFVTLTCGVAVAAAACARGDAGAPAPRTATVGRVAQAPIVIEEPAAEPAPSDDGVADADADDGAADVIRPCHAGTPEHVGATSALRTLSRQIDGLRDSDSARPAVDALVALLATSCFELSTGAGDELAFHDVVALKSWWRGGGRTWLDHYLRVAKDRWLYLPPSPRRALTTTTAPGHALAPLLCPASALDAPDTCGRETAGWVRRASTALAAGHGATTTDSDCAAEAKSKPLTERYTAFHDCVESGAARVDALPIGRFRAPAVGWFVTGRSDGNDCGEIQAYELATGAAYRAEGCASGRRAITVEVGRVPVAAMREAAWMTMLAFSVDERVRASATMHKIPPEVPILRPRGDSIGLHGIGMCGGGSPPRSWSWLRPKSGAYTGQVHGRLSECGLSEAKRHALALVEIAEDGFEAGCAPAGPPARLRWSSLGVMLGDTAAELDDASLEPLRLALARARGAAPKGGVCAPLP